MATETLSALRAKMRDRGLLAPRPGRVVAELSLHVTLAIGGILLFLWTETLLLQLLAAIMVTLGQLGVGTNTHTSSHGATSRKAWLNEALTYFGYPFFLQMSATYWWNSHCEIHHPAPNVVGVDQDVDLSPWLALTKPEVERSGRLLRAWYKVQWVFFPLILLGNGFNVQLSSWRYLLGCLRDPQRRTHRHWIDLGVMLAHLAFWVGLPMIWFDPLTVLGLYALRIGLMGYAMFIVLAPGHFPMAAAAVTQENVNGDYALLQTANTVNFTTGRLGTWLCSGLQFQVEHHLFPNLSHANLPRIAPMVREFCARNGLPYHSMSWPRAVWECWRTLRVHKPVHGDLEALRLQVEATLVELPQTLSASLSDSLHAVEESARLKLQAVETSLHPVEETARLKLQSVETSLHPMQESARQKLQAVEESLEPRPVTN